MELGELYISVGDLVVSIGLLLYLVAGLAAGMVRSIIGLLRVLLLAVTITLFADLLADDVARIGELGPLAAYLSAVLVISIGLWLFFWIVSLTLKPVIEKMRTTLTDTLLGATLGFLRGMSMLMILLGLTSFMSEDLVAPLWEKSLLLPEMGQASQGFWQLFPSNEEGYGQQFAMLDYSEDYRPRLPGIEPDAEIEALINPPEEEELTN